MSSMKIHILLIQRNKSKTRRTSDLITLRRFPVKSRRPKRNEWKDRIGIRNSDFASCVWLRMNIYIGGLFICFCFAIRHLRFHIIIVRPQKFYVPSRDGKVGIGTWARPIRVWCGACLGEGFHDPQKSRLCRPELKRYRVRCRTAHNIRGKAQITRI